MVKCLKSSSLAIPEKVSILSELQRKLKFSRAVFMSWCYVVLNHYDFSSFGMLAPNPA